MASFFQPSGSGDPVILFCNLSNTSVSSWLVYCNRLADDRLQTPLQYFTLICAAVCLALPVLHWSGYYVLEGWRQKEKVMGKHPTHVRKRPFSQNFHVDIPALSSIKSFHYILRPSSGAKNFGISNSPGGFAILPLPSILDDESTYPPILTPRTSTPPLFGLVNEKQITPTTLPVWVNFLSNISIKERLVLGIIIRVNDGGSEVNGSVLGELLSQLNQKGVGTLLNFSHDNDVFMKVDFCLLSGIIVDNACILPNGDRRDYFGSQNLRHIMARSYGERLQRPSFFVGFHDTWECQPSAAVVCRAARVASHFEAVLNHGPHEGAGAGVQPQSEPIATSLSAIEHLRKREISELQQTWVQQKRQAVVCPRSKADNAGYSHLDLASLESILPGAERLLEPISPIRMRQPADEPVHTSAPLEYTSLAPPRSGFWTHAHDGSEISSLGCIPLTAKVTQRQHDTVLATQTHLRDLSMLQSFGEDEVKKLLEELQNLSPVTGHTSLLRGLIEGLAQHTILVHKGLGTGFSLPGNTGELWGVSDYRVADGIVDIFISRRCPSDARTVLHTWLAHHGVPREMIYEEELLLEQKLAEKGEGTTLLLPLSMRTAISNSTPSEILFLLQQLQVSARNHRFKKSIHDFCKATLIDDTDLWSWNDATSRGFLSGSVTIQDLLSQRLATFPQPGSHYLLSVDNLSRLYTHVETVIQNSLFSGDRSTLNKLTDLLLQAHNSENTGTTPTLTPPIDIYTDLVTLMFFCALRKAALEDVYMEATDHCPLFSQPDQAAVFSELWVLGSQCELYFCMKPRALGKIIYDRHRAFLKAHPPPVPLTGEGKDEKKGGLMSVYAKVEPVKGSCLAARSRGEIGEDKSNEAGLVTLTTILRGMHRRIMGFGALSIFCLPAIVDLLLLTFVGRGLFMTAYMGDDNLAAACYGLLMSLLISAGVTGWVGSVGNYYLSSYAYHNMIFFHIQRLSGGFMLSLTVGIVGAVIFAFKISLSSAFVFIAYLMLLSTYLNALGIMATMHQKGSPITSGRVVLWQTIPLLLISPILSTFINGHDLEIYLAVGYGFLLLVLLRYRKLCHKWMNWLDKVPVFTERDIVGWYITYVDKESGRDDRSSARMSVMSGETTGTSTTSGVSNAKGSAVRAFRESVKTYQQNLLHSFSESLRSTDDTSNDLVQRVANGLPYIEWLLVSELGEAGQQSEVFSVPWFAQVVEALKKRRQMVQGLKEHSIFMLFRYARLDIGQNIGLFLVFLMDRWVSITMSAASAPISVFSDYTSRYAICFAILYFCCSVMALDMTLEGYWKVTFDLSDERVSDWDEAEAVREGWEKARRTKYSTALLLLVKRVLLVFGCTTAVVWILVDKTEVLQLYYLYSLGYSAVVIFQFNRCFTTNVKYHILSLLKSACLGFGVGCGLHAIYKQAPAIYLDVLALNTASITAAILTSITVWKDFTIFTTKEETCQVSTPVIGLPARDSTNTTEFSHPGDTRQLRSSPHTRNSIAANSGVKTTTERTNTAIMRHLCLDIDVDAEWESLPSDARNAIFCRIVGKPVRVSRAFKDWEGSRKVDIERSDISLRLCLDAYQRARNRFDDGTTRESSLVSERTSFLHNSRPASSPREHGLLSRLWSAISGVPLAFTKWTAIISAGDANIERELVYLLRHCKAVGRILVLFLLLIWNICRYVRSLLVYVMLIHHHKSLVDISRLAKKGASRTLCRDWILAELRRKTFTGFISRGEAEDGMKLEIFDGNCQKRPLDVKPASRAVYDGRLRLIATDNTDKTTSLYTFSAENNTRIPDYKTVIAQDVRRCCSYDQVGRAVHGTVAFGPTEYLFQYSYHVDTNDVLSATFRLNEPGFTNMFTIYWGVPVYSGDSDPKRWMQSERVSRGERQIGDKVYVTTYDYQHRRDPTITTVVLDGSTEAKWDKRPPRVFNHEELFQTRPSDVSFEDEDLLFYHNPKDISRALQLSNKKFTWASLLRPSTWRYRRKKSLYHPVPTWWLRTELWSSWRKTGQFDAITACWVDEFILRSEPTLRRYWAWRGAGQLGRGRKALDARINKIGPAIEIAQDISEVCLLPIKTTDLYAMGLGKDANQVTTRPEDCFKDTEERISVIFNDVGCWPDAPGGVSNCRRDLVNGHSTIRNHVLAESGNEHGIPRFQIERNVQSMKLVPLWGLDGRTPNHGLIDNLLESEVDNKISNTDTKRDIVGTFVPLLKLFVKGARSKHISRDDMARYSNVMLDMFKYFEHKDYNKTWKSKEVASAWVNAWLTHYDDPDVTNPGEYFEIEKPSMSDFRSALGIYTSYFFIFSVQTPENCPQVFQSTHHGISSLFGMLLKYRRGTTFGIWDHAILWRECCLNISPAQTTLPLPVQSMLLAGMGLAMRLAYFQADVVLPCTSVFNPVWEGDLATDSGRLGHVKAFNRKIDPIVNGVSNMDAFQPVDEVRTAAPTVVMLSNVQFIKDIKTAILAADVVVNQYGFGDYQLWVYGAQDREPEYAIDMARMIESSGLAGNVILKGFGKPQEILKDAWLFMNSSLSEGLPLAVAEAALAAVPVVATAVGATSLILTDPDEESVSYGEVVPPNDPIALARAQISILAMVGPWARFVGGGDGRLRVTLPDEVSREDSDWLSKRMHNEEIKSARRQLGMETRKVVLRGFHGERYLREHEQMYWIQWHLAGMRRDPDLKMDSIDNSSGNCLVRWVDDVDVRGGRIEQEGEHARTRLTKRKASMVVLV